MKTLFVTNLDNDKWEERAWENNPNFQKFENRGKWYRNFPDKFLEIPEAVQGRS